MVLGTQLEKQISLLQAQSAQARMHDAYAAFVNTLGREISPVSDTPVKALEGRS